MPKMFQTEGGGNIITTVVKSVMKAYLLTLFLIAILAALVTFTSYPETAISAAIVIITLLSTLIGGAVTAAGIRSKGWINGGCAGAVYMVILFLTGLIFSGGASFAFGLIMLVAGTLSGAVGGIMGVNMTPRRR